MEQNPYEAPKTDQKQGTQPDRASNAGTFPTFMVLGCLMFPACFIAFFCTYCGRGGGFGAPESPVDEIIPFVAAAIVFGVFIIAMFLNRKTV